MMGGNIRRPLTREEWRHSDKEKREFTATPVRSEDLDLFVGVQRRVSHPRHLAMPKYLDPLTLRETKALPTTIRSLD